METLLISVVTNPTFTYKVSGHYNKQKERNIGYRGYMVQPPWLPPDRENKAALRRGNQLLTDLEPFAPPPRVLTGEETNRLLCEINVVRTKLIAFSAEKLVKKYQKLGEFISIARHPAIALRCNFNELSSDEESVFLIDLK